MNTPCPIMTPARLLVLVGLGLGVGVGLGLGNQVAISRRGVIIWQGVENGHNTGTQSLCLQTWCNDAVPCSNFPRKPTHTTQIRKHYYKLTVVNRAKVY